MCWWSWESACKIFLTSFCICFVSRCRIRHGKPVHYHQHTEQEQSWTLQILHLSEFCKRKTCLRFCATTIWPLVSQHHYFQKQLRQMFGKKCLEQQNSVVRLRQDVARYVYQKTAILQSHKQGNLGNRPRSRSHSTDIASGPDLYDRSGCNMRKRCSFDQQFEKFETSVYKFD